MADIEVANLGDGLAVALRALVSMTPRVLRRHRASLLLSDAIGGNSHAAPRLPRAERPRRVVCHSDHPAAGHVLPHHPLTNDSFARGLLQRHYWHTQTLHEQLVVAESKLTREVEQIASASSSYQSARRRDERLQRSSTRCSRTRAGRRARGSS